MPNVYKDIHLTKMEHFTFACVVEHIIHYNESSVCTIPS